MAVNIVHVDAGEKELIKDDGAKVFVLKLVSHRDQGRHQAVHESILIKQ
jgi:hypothetical protein